jgi:uncharacterized membrane protein
MSEWEIVPLLFTVMMLQTLSLLFGWAQYSGIYVQLIPEIVNIVLLLFIPGVLLLKILNLESIDNGAELFILSVGSSVAILMFTGFFINTTYHYLGIIKPLSYVPMLISLNAIIYSLCLIVYLQNRNAPTNFKSKLMDTSNITSVPVLILLLIPFLSIFGAYLMNYNNNNILLIILIILIGVIVFLTVSDRFINKNLYPFAVFIITISLLLHNSLISPYIWGWDSNLEYYIANQIIGNGAWMVGDPNNYNSMLSIVVLAPLLTIFSGINLVWIMKLVYPFLFSLMPVSLYFIFKTQTSPKIAFLSVFLVVLMFTFYTEMLSILREMVAELFLALLILLVVSDDINLIKRGILGVIFGISIVVSHYGIAYIILFGFSFVLITTALIKSQYYNWCKNKFKALKNETLKYVLSMSQLNVLNQFSANLASSSSEEQNLRLSVRIDNYKNRINGRRYMESRMLTFFFVGFFVIFLFTWYIYTSDGSTFSTFLSIGNKIGGNLADMMNSNTSQGLNIALTQQISLLRTVHKDFYLVSQFFILVGIVLILLKMDGMKFKKDYKIFSVFAFFLLVSGLMVPYFASEMNTTRLYHVSLLFLAPITIVGMLRLSEISSKIIGLKIKRKTVLQLISIFLIIFMIFDTGLVYQFLGNGDTISMSLSSNVDFPKFNDNDLAGAQWLRYNFDSGDVVYSDTLRSSVLQSFFTENYQLPPYDDLVKNKSYIYLSTFNVVSGSILLTKMSGANIMQQSYVSPDTIISNRSKIYDNGGSWIFGEKNGIING